MMATEKLKDSKKSLLVLFRCLFSFFAGHNIHCSLKCLRIFYSKETNNMGFFQGLKQRIPYKIHLIYKNIFVLDEIN